MKHVHAILGFPFCPSSLVSTLPLALGGFDFPSLARINDGIAIDGLARDLNHHIPAYRTMALITLADWTCQINRCVYPLNHEGLSRSFTCFTDSIPAAWIIAHSQMSKLGLSLRQTDQSHLLDGQCSVSHALSLIKLSNPQVEHPTGHAIWSIRSMGCHLLCHIGTWTVNCQGLTTFVVRALLTGNWSFVQRKNWSLFKNFFSLAHIGVLFSGPADLRCCSLGPLDGNRLRNTFDPLCWLITFSLLMYLRAPNYGVLIAPCSRHLPALLRTNRSHLQLLAHTPLL
jgi:hypothetical protein